MAGAIVGGAFLSSFLNVLFYRMASSQVVAFFKRNKFDDRLLQKLETAMIPAAGLLDVAEEKQIKEPTVQKWLDLLKDAVYEADDLLDEIAYEAQWLELQAEDQNFSRTEQIEEKLRDLLQRFDYLVKRKDVLDLKDYRGEKRSPHTTPMPRTPSSSLVGEFFGREVDRKEIMKLLRSEDANGKNPVVVPIVGMGGVGKTALAQHVYNRSEVQECFDLKAWVCVSEDFSVLKLTKVILEGFSSKPAFDNLDQLQLQLKNSLLKKKFLLVLDDVWNEDYAEWVTLLTPLKGGAQGSKILVTTRSGSVASVMQTVPVHHLKELTEDDCWSVFSEHAFPGENPNAYEELQQIGRAIATKCKGLPLAAKILGGLLRVKRHVKEWRKILKSNLWDLTEDNNILPALRLSYRYLQSHLKQCFAYCAMFPKGYSFQKDELVLLWMAEGFLVHSAVDDEMEEAGAECFDNLLSRSFFQQSSASPSSFVMHDLMHDLAIHVSGQFCFSSQLGGNNSSMATRRTRHLSLEVDTEGGFSSTKLENIREAQLLRTFRTSPPGWMCPPGFYEEIFQSTHCRLRVLFMTNCRVASMLSRPTINLKHLRYLDLSRSHFVTLPEKVSTFLNLQTLTLKNCKQLASLPDLGNLKHLRHLNLEGTRIESLPASLERLINLRYLTFNISDTPLKEMPRHIGQLTKLQTLTAFLVGRQSDTSIKELGKLRHLRGELHIKNLQNVVDALDAVEANLKGKEHLDKLRFTWDGDARDPQHVTSSTVLENLEPNRNVKDLRIDGYGGIRFPEWVGESSFSNIVSLVLIRCTNCTSLPPLGQLASLEHLSIEEFDKVEIVDSKFYGNCTTMKKPFESLKTLSFRRMRKWREWISDEGSREAFPLLEELSIKECPNLAKALPSHHLPHVTRLRIEECKLLATPLPRFPKLHSLNVSGFHSLESQAIEQMGCSPSYLGKVHIIRWSSLKHIPLNLFPKLNSLTIFKCPDLESLCAHERPHLNSLHSLDISECPKLVSFPKGGLLAPVLTQLKLIDCRNLKLLPESMHSLLPSLNLLEIKNCLELELCPKGSFPSNLQSLDIRNCNKLIAGRMQWGLQTLPSLSHFEIRDHKNVESFPEEMLLPSSLTSLEIFDLKDLKSLDYKGFQHLTSLRQLMIFYCPMLESIPKRLPSSLLTLEIVGCPMLKSLSEERLPSSLSSLVINTCPKLNKKKYWNKISHIPHKNIDGLEV